MLKHIVAWKCKDGFTEEENRVHLKKIKAGLEALPQFISDIVSIEVLTDPAKTSDKSAMLISVFSDDAALERYRVHPEHKKVAAFVHEVMTDRVCLDFYD